MKIIGVRTYAENKPRTVGQLTAKFHFVSIDAQFFHRHGHCNVTQWCSASIGHKHYWVGYRAFWFTHERDAVIFRLAWI